MPLVTLSKICSHCSPANIYMRQCWNTKNWREGKIPAPLMSVQPRPLPSPHVFMGLCSYKQQFFYSLPHPADSFIPNRNDWKLVTSKKTLAMSMQMLVTAPSRIQSSSKYSPIKIDFPCAFYSAPQEGLCKEKGNNYDYKSHNSPKPNLFSSIWFPRTKVCSRLFSITTS